MHHKRKIKEICISFVFVLQVESMMTSPDKLHDVVNAVPGLNSNSSTLSKFLAWLKTLWTLVVL